MLVGISLLERWYKCVMKNMVSAALIFFLRDLNDFNVKNATITILFITQLYHPSNRYETHMCV